MSPPSLAQFRSQKPSFALGCQIPPSRKYKQHIVQEYKKKMSRHDDYGRNSNFASTGKASCQEPQLKLTSPCRVNAITVSREIFIYCPSGSWSNVHANTHPNIAIRTFSKDDIVR